MTEHEANSPATPRLQELQRQRLRRMLADDFGHLTYAEAYARATAWNRLFHEELGNALAPRLNEHFAGVPQQTIGQMRDVATGVNAQLKQLGLAIRCPNTGRPAWLVAETKSPDEPGVCRYRFLESGDGGGRPKRYAACRTLPELSLTPLPARVESFSRRYRGQTLPRDEGGGPRR